MALVVVIIVAVAVVEAAVGSVELQRETHCQQCKASERLTANAERSNN